jgi:uncharacterized protein (DUF1778 family)
MATKTNRSSKITILQPADLKRKVGQAAAKRGMSVTSFVNHVLAVASERTLEQIRRRQISERDQRALLKMLEQPKGPSAALVNAAKRYRERYGD